MPGVIVAQRPEQALGRRAQQRRRDARQQHLVELLLGLRGSARLLAVSPLRAVAVFGRLLVLLVLLAATAWRDRQPGSFRRHVKDFHSPQWHLPGKALASP